MKKKNVVVSDAELKARHKMLDREMEEDMEEVDALCNTPYDLNKELSYTRRAIRLSENRLLSVFFQKVLRNRVITGDLREEIKDFPESKGAVHVCGRCGIITMNYFSLHVMVGCVKDRKLNICTPKCRKTCSWGCKCENP